MRWRDLFEPVEFVLLVMLVGFLCVALSPQLAHALAEIPQAKLSPYDVAR